MKRVASLLTKHLIPSSYMNEVWCRHYGKQSLDFSDVVDFVSRRPNRFTETHFRSLRQFITKPDGSLAVDYIGDLSDYSTGWNEIVSRTGLPPLENKKNVSGLNSSLMEVYCDDELKTRVEERYAADFKLPSGYTRT